MAIDSLAWLEELEALIQLKETSYLTEEEAERYEELKELAETL